ncbi:MAG: hypothetical protein H6898_00140 [Rhodobacter sp.]|nr:hypothetical protein [Rhodobacter sp.]
MRSVFLILATSTLATSALATPALADPPGPGALIAAISGDWNGDDMLDAVTLTRAEDGMADLTVYRGGGIYGLDPVLTLPAVVFAGPMAGQAPSFAPRSDSSFVLQTEQIGIGRTPWSAGLTIAWRDGGFVVAGYDYSFYDRLDLSHYGGCSVNLLTSRYELTLGPGDDAAEIHREGTTEAASFPLASLTESYAPPICMDLFR